MLPPAVGRSGGGLPAMPRSAVAIAALCATLGLVPATTPLAVARQTDAGSASTAPGAAEAPPAEGGAPATAGARGSITAAPRNLRSFSPEEVAIEVDAQRVSLRGVFEDLGPDAIEWYQHVQTLASPWFEGRAPGSAGIERAAEYIEWWMRRIGLEPAFPALAGVPIADRPEWAVAGDDWTSYRQYFELPGGDLLVNRAELSTPGTSFEHGRDFAVLGSSGRAEATAPLAFAGYGLVEGRDGYTSFDEGVRLDGRIALLLRYEPLDEEGQSLWSDRRFSEHAAILPKLRAVAERGAAGIIMVNPPGARHGKEGLETPDSSRYGGDFEIPIVQATPEAAERLLAAAAPGGGTLMDWRRRADRGEVRTVEFATDVPVQIVADVSERRVPTANVGGVLHGRGNLADEWLVIGGHYDHVGMGYFGTAPANRGQLHPGADDNASGTAAILVLARRLAEAYDEIPAELPLRSVLFMGFSAEESGLHGSRFYVRNPTVSGDRITAMVNLDMVGRLRNDELVVSGTGTAENFEEILRPHFEASGLTIRADPSGRGPSDHANFYGAGIPVLFPFTGLHAEYHTPRDHAYTVNPAGAVRVIALIEAVAMDLLRRTDRLQFRSSDASPGTDRGYAPVRLGVTPSMGQDDEVAGVLVEAVGAGSAAAEAGIQPGDVLVAWNGEDLTSTGSMMEQLRKHRPGDVVQIVLIREGERTVVNATLKASARRE
ncbi:MAG TPA: M28 family peptidase [Phycisphaerales bacterium]|nr:M28 family peptidase [Phycisphaerales bacterium]HMP36125.1 M28 family peptidase [Phycisphaerales bacterium]